MTTSMTRQHFRALADAVASLDGGVFTDVQRQMVAGAVASAVARFNPAFQRSKFLTACEPAPAETPAVGHHRRAANAVRPRPPRPLIYPHRDQCPECGHGSPDIPLRFTCPACGCALPDREVQHA
jgi:hypothetical protein